MSSATLPTPAFPTPGLASPKKVVKATLKALPSGTPLTVHFNPASLVYTVENSTPQQGGDPKRRQYAGSFTGKLTMDLQFDTTATGGDVRNDTSQVAAFMQSSAAANKNGASGNGTNTPAPSVLSFDWGAYHFQGFMESFKETIDFFSADGIPLRSLVSIGLARQDNVFDPGGSGQAAVAGNLQPGGSVVPTPNNGNPSNLAGQGGDTNAGRALAAANGLESARFTGGAALQVGGGIQLNAAVGFVASASVSAGAGISAGAGLGISAGAGAGISAGAGFGASAGASFGASAGASAGFGVSAGAGVSFGASAGASFGASAGVSFGASASAGASSFASAGASFSTSSGGSVSIAPGGGALFGSSASAGVPATLGAFAGLEVGRATVSTTANLNPLQMMPATVGSNVAVGANASFGLGGVALANAGFSTNVGGGFNLNSRLIFDGD